MKHKLLIFLILESLLIETGYSQDKPDPIKEVNQSLINNVVNNYFARFVAGQDNASLTNYLNYSIADSKLTFNGVLPLAKNKDSVNHYLSIKASGGISDGVAGIFTKSKLNTNTSIEAKWHFLNQNKWMIIPAKNDKYRIDRNQILNDFEYKRDSIILNYQKNKQKMSAIEETLGKLRDKKKALISENNLKVNIITLQEKIVQLNKSIKNVEDVLNKEKELKERKDLTDQEKRDLKEFEEEHKNNEQKRADWKRDLKKSCEDLNEFAKKITNFDLKEVGEIDNCKIYSVEINDSLIKHDSLIIAYTKKWNELSILKETNLGNQLKYNEKNKKNKLVELNDSFKIDEIRLNWSSISYSLSNNSFKFFDSKQKFEKQVSDTSYVTHSISLEHNWVKFSNFINEKSYYRVLKVSFLLTDSFDDLKKKEITNTTKIEKDSTENRVITDKFNAYEGNYERNIPSLKLSYDSYNLFNKERSIGFHFFPEMIFSKANTKLNVGLGLFMNFLHQNSDKTPKPIVNAEFYIKLNELNHLLKADSFLLNQNEIGIKIGLPINFKQL